MKNSKKTNSMYKRVAAGALSMAIVAGALPANVGGLLTGGKGIEAHAENPNNLPTAVTPNDAGIITRDGTTYTAVPAAGYHFDHWNITGFFYPENNPLISTENPYTFQSNDYNNYTITAVFAEGEQGESDVITALEVDGVYDSGSSFDFGNDYVYLKGDAANDLKRTTGTGTFAFDNFWGDDAPYIDLAVSNLQYYTSQQNWKNTDSLVLNKEDSISWSSYTKFKVTGGAGTEQSPFVIAAVEPDQTYEITVPDDYTAPTAVAGLSYDGEEHALVTGGMTEAGAAKGTMKYALGKVVTSNIGFGDLAVNDILKIDNDSNLLIRNINSIVISDTSQNIGIPSDDNSVIGIYDDDYLFFNGTRISQTNDSGAAFKVTKIDREQGIVYVEPVDENADLVWSEAVPNATNAGTYSVSWRIEGATGYNDVAPQTITATIAKATLTASTATQEGDYTAPTAAKTLKKAADEQAGTPAEYYDDLFYTGDAVDLINKGTVADGKGTMQYALRKCEECNSTDEYQPVVGNVIKPTGTYGLHFPYGYSIKIGEQTYNNNSFINKGINFYISSVGSTKQVINSDDNDAIEGAWADSGKDALRITAVDNVNKVVTIEFVDSATALTWQDTIPTATDIGTYNVSWRIIGNNYNAVQGTVISEIKEKTATVVLSNLGDAVITAANGVVVTTDEQTGHYNLTSGTYYLYTDNSVAGAGNGSIVRLVGTDEKINDNDSKTYAYKYKLTIPEMLEDSYTISHNNNWSGAVNNTKQSKLYVADGAVDTNDETQLAAILQSTGKLYYGDEPTVDNVDIKAGFENLITVKDIYLSNAQGTKLDLTSGTVTFGDYKLTAEIIVDNDGDGDFETGVNDQQICTLYADIEYAARPMSENKYFLVTENPEFNTEQAESATNKKYIETQLEVVQDTDNENNPIVGQYSVIVPETTFAYNGTAKKPEIVVKNGGNSAVLTASAPAQGTTAAVAGDYASSIEAKTNAGDYSFELTAAANTNYTDKVAVKWSIAKAKVNVIVNAKANLTYDGAVLDASDFEFTAAQNDTLAQQVIAEMTKAEGETAPKTNITVTPITENLPYTPKTGINNDNVGYYLYDTPFDQYYYHYINIEGLDPVAYIKLPGMNDPILASQASSIDFNTTPYNFVIEKGGTLEYWFKGNKYSTPLTAGNGWYLQKTIQNVSVGSDQTELRTVYEVVQKALPTKTYDLKNAGIQKAKITITNPNIDVVVNNGSSVTAEIVKKKVTITPKADQKAIFGDIKTVDDANSTVDDKFFVPEYTFDGVVDADKAIITTFGDILDVKYNKIAVGETKADVTKYGTTTEYEAVGDLGYALTLSNKKINTNSYFIDELYDYVTVNTNITLPNGENGYTFKYEDRDSSVKYDDYTGCIFINSEGTLKYTKGTLNVDEVIEVIWDNDVTTVPLTAGNVWVVTGELWSNEDDGYQNGYDGKYKSVEIKQVPVSESADFVNAGTYEFVLEKNDDGANYQFELAQNAPTYAIEQKSLKSEDIALTVSEPSYTYDGTKKVAPDDYVITDAKIGTLAKDTDFEVGGQTAAVLPNTYDLEFSGLNNYKDMIKSQWEIKSDTTYDITVSVEDKTYDGTTIVPTFAYTQKNPNFDSAQLPSEENPEHINITEADLPKNTKTTLTYYKLANDTAVPQTTEELAALNLTALEGAPKDAGKYVVVAKTTARGYVFRDCIDNFEIKQREIEVIPTITSVEYGKFDTSDITKYTYSTDNIINGDTVNVTGQLAGIYAHQEDITKYGYKVGVYNYVVPTPAEYATIPAEYKDLIIHVDNPNYKLATNATLTVTQCEIKDDDIKVTGKCVAGADGWAYPNSCVKVVVSLYNVETKQYEEVELTEGTDFDITSATKTKQLGTFTVEVDGKGNYTTDPVAVAAVDVVTEAYLNDFVKISEPFASVNSSGVGRVSATFTHEIPEGYTVTESGILYVKDANCATDLTLKNAGTAGIGKKVNTVTGSTSQTLNVTDPNGVGAKMRGYMIVAKGNNTYTVYTDEISATYAELAIKNATNIDISAPKATVNASGKGRVSATFTHEVADGYTVTESGILYVKDANCATDLTLDNVGTAGIGKKVNTVAGSTSQTLNVTDPDGNGAKMRGYVIVTDGNISKTFYTDEVSGTYIDLAFSDAVSVNISAPKATVNASGTGRVSATFTYEAADGYTVTESGMLYVKNADCATELTLDNEGKSGIGKKVNTVAGSTSQTLNVTDPNGNGAKMRGYVTVTDGTTTKTIYTDEISGKYAELSAQ